MVIPLERLGDYSDGIERINIELSLKNKIRLMATLEEFSRANCCAQEADKLPNANCSTAARRMQSRRCAPLVSRWQWLLEHLDSAYAEFERRRREGERREGQYFPSPLTLTPHRLSRSSGSSLVVSWKTEVREPLMKIFAGRAFDAIRARSMDA